MDTRDRTKLIKELLLVVNDYCDSRGNGPTLSLIKNVLSGSAFLKTQTVHLTGGEPTLRQDLPEIVTELLAVLPALKTIRLETNAIDTNHIWDTAQVIQRTIADSGKSFIVDVSLDGVGPTHDAQRGVQGNFASAVTLVGLLKSSSIPFSVQCTLTPLNCEQADDLLLWLEENEIGEYRFRLGGESALYHTGGYFQRNPYSAEQVFHLVGFFDKLAHRNRQVGDLSQYYRSLADGLSRGEFCAWPKVEGGAILDCEGNLIGSQDLQGDAVVQVFSPHMPARDRARRSKQRILGSVQAKWRNLKKRIDYRIASRPSRKPVAVRPSLWQKVLITGWYGTETTGDKAILGELIHFLRQRNPEIEITITTIDEKVSCQTNEEMEYADRIKIVALDQAYQSRLIHDMDAVIMGGGPLMESGQLEHIWRIFRRANENGVAGIIFGCGVGPIYSQRTQVLIGQICHLASAGFYRDQASHELAVRLGGNPSLSWACDPSLGYLTRWRRGQPAVGHKNGSLHIAGLLREQTREYYADGDLEKKNTWFVDELSQTFQAVLSEFSNAQIELLPMHMYWKGNDDRMFNRRIAQAAGMNTPVHVVRTYLPIDRLLESLSSADIALPMRYHGHLFALALGIPFLSVNYTSRRGKVGNLLEQIGYQDFVEDFETFDSQRACRKIKELYARNEEMRARLLAHADILVDRLNQTYETMFEGTL